MVIELSLDDVAPQSEGIGHRRPPWASAVGLIVLLVLVLTGPVSGGPALSAAWRAEAQLGFFWLDDTMAYTLSPADPGLVLVGRDLTSGGVRWRYPITTTLAALYQRGRAVLFSRFPPTLRERTSTRVLDAATGASMGTYPVAAMPLLYISGRTALIIDRDGEPPPVVSVTASTPFAPHANAFDGEKEAHRIRALDLDSGTLRWERMLAPGVSWLLPGVHAWVEGIAGSDATWFSLATTDGDVDIVDVATGTTTDHTTLGPLDDLAYVVALPDSVVAMTRVRPSVVLTAYDPGTLAARWRIAVTGVPDQSAWPVTCGGDLLCLAWPYAVWGFNTTTGRLVWHQRIVDVFDSDQPNLTATTTNGPIQIDVSSGAVRPVAGGWRVTEVRPRGREAVVARDDPDGQIWLGLLDQVAGGVRTLDNVGHNPVGRCQSTASVVGCADNGQLRVWRIIS